MKPEKRVSASDEVVARRRQRVYAARGMTKVELPPTDYAHSAATHDRILDAAERLFADHGVAGTSVRANPTNEERAVWFNPSQMGKLQMPTWRWFFEWGKSICRSPIGAAEGLKCSLELTRWAWLNRGIMRRELVHGFKKWSPVKTG